MSPLRACLAIWLALCAPALALDAVPGETRWVADHALQYLGQDAAGRDQWLYPHLDGVQEVLTDEGQAWTGELGSRFLPDEGRWETRFQVASALAVLLDDGAGAEARQRAARAVALFVALHAEERGPVYLEPARRALRRALRGEEDRAWVEAQRARHVAALARVPQPGTRTLEPPSPLRSSQDHYLALIADGYLDVAVVGGNSEDTETGEVYSITMAERLLEGLRADGFTVTGSAPPNQVDCERLVRIADHPTRIRVRVTAAASQEAPVLRGLVNFVEGLAGADVVLFYGHSNGGSGIYVSDRKDSLENFRFAAGRRDLETKCYGLGRKPHQIVALQCCLSYARYGTYLEAWYADRALSVPGLIGPADRVPKGDFAPRCGLLLSLLCAGAGPTRIARELDALRPLEKSPAMLLRGVLQPAQSYVVPAGVTVEPALPGREDDGFVPRARGSDGQVYPSTAVFPQDAPGEIVQVVGHERGVYGLTLDGRLLEVSGETGGACRERVAPSAGRSVVFLGWARRLGKRRLFLLDDEGRLRHLSRDGERLVEPTHELPPAGVRLVAVGNTEQGELLALDAEGSAWISQGRRWEPTPPVALPELTPSLRRGAQLVFGD